MQLKRSTREEVAALRALRHQGEELPLVPGFYAGLVEEAQPFVFFESQPPGSMRARAGDEHAADDRAEDEREAGDRVGMSADPAGYALVLVREHEGHTHSTLIELGLDARHQDRYEDALDLLRDKAKPTAYLARTDDCRLNATLLARGLQVEATALIMLPETSAPLGAGRPPPAPGSDAKGGVPDGPAPALKLVPLAPAHVAGIGALLGPDPSEGEEPAQAHRHGPSAAETLEEVRAMAAAGEGWVLLENGLPQAVVARLQGADTDYDLVDFVVAQGEEAGLSWAVSRAADTVKLAGRRPAAVIDALDPVRRRVLRGAGFYTAAAYMVFYDPLAGRPSVPSVSLKELQEMIARKERIHLVDVMGEEHWRAGHLPGSEWIDFRGLGREARRRYKEDDTIVVYCNGFT